MPEIFESILPICTFDHDRLSKIEFYPIELAMNDKDSCGVPRLANDEYRMRCIKLIKRLATKQ